MLENFGVWSCWDSCRFPESKIMLIVQMVSIAPGSPEAVFEGKVPIQVSYLEGSRPCSFRCEAPISVVESLRPLPLTTPQFGALWPTNTAEAKFQVCFKFE